MDARRYMERVGELKEIIDNKIEERTRLYLEAVSTGTSGNGERVQTSTGAWAMTGTVEKYVDIDRQIAGYTREIQEIICTIEMLEHDEYDVLHKKYVQGMTLKAIARKHKKSYSWVSHVHGNALISLQIILDMRKGEGQKNDSERK